MKTCIGIAAIRSELKRRVASCDESVRQIAYDLDVSPAKLVQHLNGTRGPDLALFCRLTNYLGGSWKKPEIKFK